MWSFSTALAASVLSSAALVESASHNLFVGSFKSNHLFALSYDNETHTINTERTMEAHAGHPVLGFNYDKTVIYGGERDGWTSYSVQSPTELSYMSTVALKGRCEGDEYRHGQTSLFVAQKFPYMVYGSGRSPCGAVMGIRTDGSLDSIVQNISYRTTSRVQGMVMDPPGKWLFSADQKGNGIWTHRVDPKNGKLDRGTFTDLPMENARPRRVVMHPEGKYLYVLLSKLNTVAMFEIAPKANSAPQLRYMTTTFSLLPNGIDQKLYRGADMHLSTDGNILYASVRYRAPRDDDADRSGDGEGEGEEEEEEGAEEEEPRAVSWNPFSFFGNRNKPSSGTGTSNNNNNGNSNRESSRDTDRDRDNKYRTSRSSRRNVATESTPVIFADRLDEVHIEGPDITIRQTSTPGYLTAILLSSPESQGGQGPAKGYPLQMIMQVATPTTGGKSNIVAPATWNNNYFALMDSEIGFVQVWRLDGLLNLPRDGPMASGQISMPGAPPKGGLRASQLPPPLANIRANIVAEWKAPADAVGDPTVIKGSSGRDDKLVQRVAGLWERALGRRQYDQILPSPSSANMAAAPIPSGRGCCANAVWYN